MSERSSASEHKPFPETRRSVIGALGDPDSDRRRQAFETLITVYWKPVYTYLRLFKRVERAAAEDLTQGFFAHAFEQRTLDGYDPARARFRTWLRRCLDGYVANQHKAAQRLKRGGAYAHLPLDFENAEGDLRHYDPPASEDLETFFQREWTRALFALAVDELRRESLASGRGLEFALFERYDLEAPQGDAQPTYAELAREFSISAGKVTNSLHAMRSRLRRKVLSRLRETCGSEAEYRAEARTLFGHDPK
ncbi:MAG TPA: sigma-70 family RNA polymerase sigma factor [Acidobacteriota bacterium]